MPFSDAWESGKSRRGYNEAIDPKYIPEQQQAKWDWDTYWNSFAEQSASSRNRRALDSRKTPERQLFERPVQKQKQSNWNWDNYWDSIASKSAASNGERLQKTQHIKDPRPGYYETLSTSEPFGQQPQTYQAFTDYFNSNLNSEERAIDYWKHFASSKYYAAVRDFIQDSTVFGDSSNHRDRIPFSNRRSSSSSWFTPQYKQPPQTLNQEHVFPGLVGITVSSVVNPIASVISFGIAVYLIYEYLIYLKKVQKLTNLIDSLERITGLNFSWVLYLFDVDPTEEYLANSRARTKIRAIENPDIFDVADGSGHPKKGRSLFNDIWIHKRGVPEPNLLGTKRSENIPGAISNKYNSAGWREPQQNVHSRSSTATKKQEDVSNKKSSFNIMNVEVKSLASLPASLFGKQVLIGIKAQELAESTSRPSNRTKETYLFNYHIEPRIIYPTRGDPDRPYLATIPKPIAAVLDLNDQIWETAVDTAAWTVGVTAVRPVGRIVKRVSKFVNGVGEWVSWTDRYSRQTVRRALGYSKQKGTSKVEILSNKRFA